MTGKELLQHIQGDSGNKILSDLYGQDSLDQARKRYHSLIEATMKDFPETASEMRVFTAAGRTELGGNHTDHNHGKVLAASIQLDALAFVKARTDNKVLFRSTGYPDVVVDLSDLSPQKEEIGTTEALVRGIAAEFSGRGTKVGGFTANAASTVLSGSGLSSSAAVEVLFGTIFDYLYGNGTRSAVEIAQIGQKAENVYFGKPCGLMDQTACASGGAVAIDFANPESPLVRRVDFNLRSAGFALCVLDTGGNHADLTPDYAAVPSEMKAVAKLLGKQVLRELDKDAVLSEAVHIRKKLGDRALLRALHFFAENDRVEAMLTALEAVHTAFSPEEKKEHIRRYLQLVDESGNSSWELLQNVFSPRIPEEQGVSLALALTRDFLKGSPGVCRVHGGGFAGTIQAYIPLEAVKDYRKYMAGIFGEQAVTVLKIRSIGASELHFG